MIDDDNRLPKELEECIKKIFGAQADEVLEKFNNMFVLVSLQTGESSLKYDADSVRNLMNILMSKLQSLMGLIHAAHCGMFGGEDINQHIINNIGDTASIAKQFYDAVVQVYGDQKAVRQQKHHENLKDNMFSDLMYKKGGHN